MKKYKNAGNRGERYFFDHKIRRGMALFKKTGSTLLYNLEFQDASFPNGTYALVGWKRPTPKGNMIVSMRDNQGHLLDIPWVFGNIAVHGISTAKCDHEKKELIVCSFSSSETELPVKSAMTTMQTQLAKIESLASLLGLDALVQEAEQYALRES
jgi:hypothetical protein